MVIPPSFNRQNGKAYEWVEGGLDRLTDQLPPLNPGSINRSAEGSSDTRATTSSSKRPKSLRKMREGDGRNDALFQLGLALMPQCDTDNRFNERLSGYNDMFAEPLPLPELNKISRSILNYKRQGRLFLPGCEAHAVISNSQSEALADQPDALCLLIKLQQTWAVSSEPFPVAVKAMAEHGTLRWSRDRIRRARDTLVNREFLICVHQGGRGPKDPSLYCFGPRA